jgi:hypothetical protein
VKTLALVSFLPICMAVRLFALPPGYDVYQEKRFVMEFRSQDQKTVLGVELVIAKPGDDGRSPMEVLERQLGLKWSGLERGEVYRFEPASRKWELIMGRDLHSTERIIGAPDRAPQVGLKISELQSGDVIICTGPFVR